jgi:ribonuclease R
MHRLGDVVDVRLVEAAPVAGALRFELLSEGQVVPRGRKRDGKRDVLKSQRAEKERSHHAARHKEPKRGKQKSGKSGKGKSWRR